MVVVRAKLLEMMPRIKQTFRLHSDRVQLHDLEFAMEKLRASFREKEFVYYSVCRLQVMRSLLTASRPCQLPCRTRCKRLRCSTHLFVVASICLHHGAQETETVYFEEGIIDQQKQQDEDAVAKIEQEELERAKAERSKKSSAVKTSIKLRKRRCCVRRHCCSRIAASSHRLMPGTESPTALTPGGSPISSPQLSRRRASSLSEESEPAHAAVIKAAASHSSIPATLASAAAQRVVLTAFAADSAFVFTNGALQRASVAAGQRPVVAHGRQSARTADRTRQRVTAAPGAEPAPAQPTGAPRQRRAAHTPAAPQSVCRAAADGTPSHTAGRHCRPLPACETTVPQPCDRACRFS